MSTKKVLLEQLEADKHWRIEERAEAGEIVVVEPYMPVVGGQEDAEDAIAQDKERKLAEVRAAGETRPVHFVESSEAIEAIITGVPRSDRDPKYCTAINAAVARGDYETPTLEAKPVEPKSPPLPAPKPVEALGPPRSFWVTVRTPDPTRPNDAGQIEEGKFLHFSDGRVEVKDAQGRPVGTAVVPPGDDALAAARKVLRDHHGKHGAFHGPISYPRPPSTY